MEVYLKVNRGLPTGRGLRKSDFKDEGILDFILYTSDPARPKSSLVLCQEPDGSYHISSVYTYPSWRKRGLASLLLNVACWFVDLRGRRLTLSCGPELVKFYEKFGFKVQRVLIFGTEELLEMERPSTEGTSRCILVRQVKGRFKFFKE